MRDTRIRPRPAIAMALIVVLICGGGSAAAQDEEPIHIEADSIELDEASATSRYLGNVVVVQGSMRIEADEVEMLHRPDRRPEHVTAWGNPAKYRQTVEGEPHGNRAEARRMEYAVDRDEITLIDEAVLYQGNDRFSSDRIVYDRANARVKAGGSARGSERVKITITPESQ